ncbi:MAG TPA: SDR family oxidoreductase [Acidimicrobiales bacterium]|nr:SDR family oxidoreductase [Acidimicrobiales bacterium]
MTGVLVTGGSGTLGSHVVRLLRAAGHDVRVLSRRPGGGTHQGDLASGAGVAEAVQGVTHIVHAASDTRRFGRRDLAQTGHLLDACGPDVEHLLYVSIVGIDQVPYRYYRKKLECEGLIEASPVPSTILRATQFHELLAMAFTAVQKLPVAPLPAGLRLQTVAAGDVAAQVVSVLEQEPVGRAADFGGPEVVELSRMAQLWQQRHHRPRRFAWVPLPGRVMRGVRQGLLTCPDHADGQQSWAQFLAL